GPRQDHLLEQTREREPAKKFRDVLVGARRPADGAGAVLFHEPGDREPPNVPCGVVTCIGVLSAEGLEMLRVDRGATSVAENVPELEEHPRGAGSSPLELL